MDILRRQHNSTEGACANDTDVNDSKSGCTDELLSSAGWSWICRHLNSDDGFCVRDVQDHQPKTGDTIIARVQSVRKHTRLNFKDDKRLRLYENDIIIGALGTRYATDAFEAVDINLSDLHILTGAGMFGTVKSRHKSVSVPTQIQFLGYVCEKNGTVINLKDKFFEPKTLEPKKAKVILVVGSGMNAGKTTTMTKLLHGLINVKKQKVAGCKLTGSVSQRDIHEILATGAIDARDFSDYGFPSTYLCSEKEVLGLFNSMVNDMQKSNPDIIVMEIADGFLQRETQMLLNSKEILNYIDGVVLAAHCAPSALYGVDFLKQRGHKTIAVSGMITSSPLFVQEFAELSSVPVGTSAVNNGELAHIVFDGVN